MRHGAPTWDVFAKRTQKYQVGIFQSNQPNFRVIHFFADWPKLRENIQSKPTETAKKETKGDTSGRTQMRRAVHRFPTSSSSPVVFVPRQVPASKAKQQFIPSSFLARGGDLVLEEHHHHLSIYLPFKNCPLLLCSPRQTLFKKVSRGPP